LITVKRQAIFLLIISASMLILLPPTVRADAPKPILSVGDMWKYSITSPTGPGGSSSGSFTGSLTQTVRGTETVTVGGQSLQSYKIGLSGTGTFTILAGTLAGTSDSFTLSGASYRRVSDLADARDTISVVISAGFFSVTVSAEAVSSPPLQFYDFPLSTGKSWTSTASVNVTSTAPNFGGTGTSTMTNSSTVSARFNVESMERITVEAGAFQTYKIKEDITQTYRSNGQSTTFSQESYYSPMAGNIVKGAIPVGGAPFFNLELVDYTAHPYNSQVNVSNGGKSYSIGVNTNVEATGTTSNSTAITFNVDGFGTGKANVRIPAALNNTAITVYEDAGIIASTSTKNGTEYDIQFGFALSQHKISIIYGKPPSGLAFFLGLLTNPIAIIAYIIIAVSVAAVAAVREPRRRRPSVPAPEPTETGPGANGSPSPPVPPPPSTESPAQLPSTNN